MATESITDNFLTRLDQCRQEINQLFTELSTKLSDRRQALLEELDGIQKRYADSNKAEDNWKQLTAVLNEQKASLAAMEKVANSMTQQKTSLENISNLMTPETKRAQLKTINPMIEAPSNMKLAIKDMEQDCYRWRMKIETFTSISFQADTTHLTSSINQLGAISVREAPDYTNRTTPIVLYDAARDNFLTRLDQCRQEINQLFAELSTKLSDRRQALLEELDGIQKRYADSNKAKDNWKQLTAVLNEQKAGLVAIEKTANLMTQQKTSLENISNLMTPETKEAQLKTIKPMMEAPSNMKLAIKDMEQDCYRWRMNIETFTDISFQADTTHLTSSINQLGAISVRTAPDYTNRTTPIVLYDAARGTGKGKLYTPYGIALDNDNNIYIADYASNKIIAFSISGEFIREFGQGYLDGPHYICITNTNIYVSNSWSPSIVKFSIAGEFIGKIGTRGSNNIPFKYPCGIAYYNTLIYVCDCNNNRIQVLSEDLKYHKTIKHDNILQPRDIKIQQDSIYVSTGTSIHILSVAGEYISTLPHTFSRAWYIALDRYNNNIIISSVNTITIISLYDNSIIHTIDSNNTTGIAVTSSNIIVIVCCDTNSNTSKLLLF